MSGLLDRQVLQLKFYPLLVMLTPSVQQRIVDGAA